MSLPKHPPFLLLSFSGCVVFLLWLTIQSESRFSAIRILDPLKRMREEISSIQAPSQIEQPESVPSSPWSCSPQKPNLVLTALNKAVLGEELSIFMNSLEQSLAQEALKQARRGECPPPHVEVKVIMPPETVESLPPAFKAIQDRFTNLEFVGVLPYIKMQATKYIVFTRFMGWAKYIANVYRRYDKVLVCDVDLIFQRNPFTIELKPGATLTSFAEWRGLSIGNDNAHALWFQECSREGKPPSISGGEWDTIKPLSALCAGSTYGTAAAINLYIQTMAEKLSRAQYRCNDQAMHQHLFYSGKLDSALSDKGLGRTQILATENGPLGTLGTTPMVAFNAWGEILNEANEVYVVVHQFKRHKILRDMIRRKYRWSAPAGVNQSPPIPALEIDETWSAQEQSRIAQQGKGEKDIFVPRWRLKEQPQTCKSEENLCSCKDFQSPTCQFPWSLHAIDRSALANKTQPGAGIV